MTSPYPNLHVVVYSDPGAGKSTFATTFPGPILVFQFDPSDKGMPYLRSGLLKDIGPDENGTERIEVYTPKKRKLMIRVEQYFDDNPERPQAWERFLKRMRTIAAEADHWGTIVLDSITYGELAALNQQRYKINPNSRDGRQWYAGAKDSMQNILAGRLANFPTNVIVIAHTGEEKDEVNGSVLYGIHTIGKLKKVIPAGFGEVYRLGIKRSGKETLRYLQTDSDGKWHAASAIGAPNPCEPMYSDLWENFEPLQWIEDEEEDEDG